MENMVNDSNLKDHYHNKSVFVTAHIGFKGSWFCTILLYVGAKVKGYALDLAYDNPRFGYLLLVANLHKNPS
jgi:CDP-glucose 4,6-dehydratase